AAGAIPLVRGAEGSGRRTLVGSAARAIGARLLLVSCQALPAEGLGRALTAIRREAVLARAVIVFVEAERLAEDHETGRPDRAPAVEAAFVGYPGPLAMTARTHAQPRLFGGTRGTVAIDLPALSEAERSALWARWLPDAGPELIADAAARYRLAGGAIERAARAVRDRAGEAPSLASIHAGVRAVLDDKLTSLGVRIEWRQRWEDLVLPEDSLDELLEMIGRVRHRRRVLDDWGFGDRLAKGLGVAALFSGPPGTGKTMAAGLIAGELGLDLYQIDLSRMVSKFIGETEKNLSQVFDAAETGHVVLLFDEADSLFSKRTDVKTSTDRYANLEVNYLLQRMESFTGITILTTNFDSAIDDAFRRRLAFRIAFPLPEPDERARLWQAIIPTIARAADIDFNSLARKYAMSGGFIRNAALRAAYLAAGDNARITMQHLVKAASAEYASMGKVMSSGVTGGLR
ncbi:MAG: ATP-binding protein, partial [Kofleriaceae bacterium]